MSNALSRLIQSSLLISVWLVVCGNTFYTKPQNNTAVELLNKSLAAIKQIKTLNVNIRKWERFKGKTTFGAFRVRQQVEPYKLYFYQLKPGEGQGTQAIYIKGQNQNKILIKMGSFPYLTLNLSPYGGLVLKESHHSVLHIGFHFFGDIIQILMKRKSTQMNQIAHYKGMWNYGKHLCHKIELYLPDYRYTTYKVQVTDKHLEQIADPLGISAHRILELNPDLDSFEDIKAGQVLKVPTEYGSKIELYIDPNTNLPVALNVEDPLGFFEKFEFDEVTINPTYSATEFTRAHYKM